MRPNYLVFFAVKIDLQSWDVLVRLSEVTCSARFPTCLLSLHATGIDSERRRIQSLDDRPGARRATASSVKPSRRFTYSARRVRRPSRIRDPSDSPEAYEADQRWRPLSPTCAPGKDTANGTGKPRDAYLPKDVEEQP